MEIGVHLMGCSLGDAFWNSTEAQVVCWVEVFQAVQEFLEKVREVCWSKMDIQTCGTSKVRKALLVQDKHPDVVLGLAQVVGWVAVGSGCSNF